MTKEEANKIVRKIIDWRHNNPTDSTKMMENAEAIEIVLSRPSLPSNLDEAANSYSSKTECAVVACRGFKAGAEWMAGQGWSLDGEVKDRPTGGDDFEIYLDYDRDKMENILDKICDYVNANYPDDDNRYKVIIQIRKKQ